MASDAPSSSAAGYGTTPLMPSTVHAASAREVPQRFAVAFSMAGEHRHLVLQVAQEVEAILGRCQVFYDDWYEHWISVHDSDLLLQNLYAEKTDLVVVCVSGAYGEKAWTQIEHRAVRASIMKPGETDRYRVLTVRVGDGDVPGVLLNQIVPDFREKTVAEAANLIIARLNLVRGKVSGSAPDTSRWPSAPPNLRWPMANHSESREAFARLLSESSASRALLVKGASQTGKSHMSRQMAWNAMSIPAIVCGRFDFKGTTNIGVEVDAFAQPLGIESPAGRTLIERLASIFIELRRRARPTVLIFDTYEAAGDATEWIERVLLPHLHSASWLRIVVIGQSVPSRVGTTWESVADCSITLRTPDANHWVEYARENRGDQVEEEFVIEAHRLCYGNASILAGLLGPKP